MQTTCPKARAFGYNPGGDLMAHDRISAEGTATRGIGTQLDARSALPASLRASHFSLRSPFELPQARGRRPVESATFKGMVNDT